MDLADALSDSGAGSANQTQGQWPGGGNSGWPSAPGGNSGWPSAPGGNSGFPSAPGGNSGFPSAPGGNSGWPPTQGGNSGFPSAPGGNSGFPSAPGGNSGFPSAPGGNSGWPPAQGGNSGFPSAPGQPAHPSWPVPGGGGNPNPPPPGPGGWSNPTPGPGPGGWSNPTPGPKPGPAPTPVAPQQSLKVPYSQKLPNGVFDKQLITIAGTINSDASKITVDLCSGKDVAFHFTARFNENGRKVIVRNSRFSDRWGKEERETPNFPFTPGRSFEMKILCTNSGFKVAVDGNHLFEFHHRVRDLKSIQFFNIHQDLKLSKVLVETIR